MLFGIIGGGIKLLFHMTAFIYLKSSLTRLLQLFLTSQILSFFTVLGAHLKLRTGTRFFLYPWLVPEFNALLQMLFGRQEQNWTITSLVLDVVPIATLAAFAP